MGWVEKEQATPFDNLPIQGLFYLDGDMLARLIRRNWTVGEKLPMIAFPSGKECEVWETSNPEAEGIVHVFGEMDLPYRDTRDRAFEQANDIAEQCGYVVRKTGDDRLEVWGSDDDEHYAIIYDNTDRQMIDVQPVRENTPRPHQPLLPDGIRARLPALYSNEQLGLNALAQVKFFTPDGQWTWYASEFDGEDTFFGLVIGFEMELGYFSLSELESARGPLGLPVERDLFFKPMPFSTLLKKHERAFRS